MLAFDKNLNNFLMDFCRLRKINGSMANFLMRALSVRLLCLICRVNIFLVQFSRAGTFLTYVDACFEHMIGIMDTLTIKGHFNVFSLTSSL